MNLHKGENGGAKDCHGGGRTNGFILHNLYYATNICKGKVDLSHLSKVRMSPCPPGKGALIDATDDVAAASDLLKLLYLAGAGMGQDQGAAIARGAMIAHDHLVAVRARIQEARNEVQRPNHAVGAGPEGTMP